MKKTILFLFVLTISIGLFAADDVEIVLSGNASTDHFVVKDNSSNTIFMVRGNGVVNIPTLSSAPSSPAEGDIYTDNTSHKIFYYDGTSWVDLTTAPESDPTLTDDQYITIGDGSTNVIELKFHGSTDGKINWDPTNSSFDFVNNGTYTLNATSSGIINLPNQSRVRVYQYDPSANNPSVGQLIPFQTWTDVYYQNVNYDAQGEFTTGATTGSSYFTATEAGYYQINARADFILIDDQGNPVHNPQYQGYVSIAIFEHNVQGGGAMLSQGNKLQGADNDYSNYNDMQNNLAPNISDVLYLGRGSQIEIRVWQSLYNAGGGLPLRNTEQNGTAENPVGSPQVYVSIHKLS